MTTDLTNYKYLSESYCNIDSINFISPFKIGIEPMKHLLVVDVQNCFDFEMLEPQIFDDPINGKGLRVLRYRKDKKVDVYWEPGVAVDLKTFNIGSGLGDCKQIKFTRSIFKICNKNIHLDVQFTDLQGRENVIRIEQNEEETNRLNFLAPVGKDIKNPKQLFFAYMKEFDFVLRKGTKIFIMIGDEILQPASLPILRNNKRVHFIRYSAEPVIGTINPPETNCRQTDLNQKKFPAMQVVLKDEDRAAKLFIEYNNNFIEMKFDNGLPNLSKIKENAVESGNWTYLISGEELSGGTYKIFRKENLIATELDVIKKWEPKDLPLALRIFTGIISSFKTWPTTYFWRGQFDLNNYSFSGEWKRKTILKDN
ncbi:MAG: hypothetical protein KKB34_00745 [Bacteroidetes bacterium]|nr:hypothetical protein [Bacteroidota bacterium]